MPKEDPTKTSRSHTGVHACAHTRAHKHINTNGELELQTD